ncbi:hypothetical protein AGR6A_Cc10070 [Agrobacterium sp. NCPPB 925]|nr:hypothetical protein AGR6A_Cc10070 [Agrobacterium sp. NCPPB 925]
MVKGNKDAYRTLEGEIVFTSVKCGMYNNSAANRITAAVNLENNCFNQYVGMDSHLLENPQPSTEQKSRRPHPGSAP